MGRIRRLVVLCATTVALFCGSARAQFGDWPDVFDPLQLLTMHLEMEPGDWQTVQNDESLSIEVPATFWVDGESPILISVRRKSGDPLGAAPQFSKVSLKLDINEYVAGQSWHGLKKLSLENGDDQDVVSEGLAWQLERLASGTHGYGYQAGHFAWVHLFINGVDTGVYVNVEQRDKRFLENRGLFVEGVTWLYKVSDINGLDLKVGGPQESPTVEALCYEPFNGSQPCPQPDLAADVPQYVDMNGILTLLASDAFQANPDAMLTHAKNFYFADFIGPTRMYFPWDRDSSISGGGVNDGIYGDGSDYASLLNVAEFRGQYSQIFSDLVCGPWSAETLVAFLDAVEPVVADALASDPNNQFGGSVAEHFDSLRNWVNQRVTNVMGAIEGFQACPTIQVDLNEFMATNAAFLEDPEEPGEFPDWFELHNPGAAVVDLGGLFLTDDLADPMKYEIPSGVMLPGNGFLLFYADSDPEQGPLHTSFKLAAAGETLAVFDTNGVTQIDSITFGSQVVDVSYGRFPNGSGPWGFMSTPTPEAANVPHNAPPVISETDRVPPLPTDSDPVWISSMVTDDVIVSDVTLHYDAGAGFVDVTMLDDGANNDGAADDGVYGAQIPAFANDTVVKYYIAATDDLGAASTDPPNAPTLTFSYVVGYTPPLIYINEFMADNDTVIEDPDEPLAYEDWIELYNGGPSTVDLSGMYLTDDLTFPTKSQIPSGISIPAGGYLIFWADSDAAQGPFHTNFKLGAGGEQIGLFDTNGHGNVPIDTLAFGAQVTDVSQGRCPDGSDNMQFFSASTPGASNQPCGTDSQACCLPGNACQDMDAVICASSGGIPQGSDSSCPASCPECIVDQDCDDGIKCTIDACDQLTKVCGHAPFDTACDNGLFCDGAEACDLMLGCQIGTDPCPDPDVACDEESDVCVECLDQPDCDDGNLCTEDVCDMDGTCSYIPLIVLFGDIWPLDSPDGAIDFDDIVCALDGFANYSACPAGDLVGPLGKCSQDGIIDFDDILQELEAFAGTAACPDPCPAPAPIVLPPHDREHIDVRLRRTAELRDWRGRRDR